MAEEKKRLPLGFKFLPTDAELCSFLLYKVSRINSFSHDFIVESEDVYRLDPWVLPKKSNTAGARYFLVLRRKESQSGERKLTEGEGWWKDMSQDKNIVNGKGDKIGLRKTFNFFRYKDNRRSCKMSTRSRWFMHEYSLLSYVDEQGNEMEEWVLCKIKEESEQGTCSGETTENPAPK